MKIVLMAGGKGTRLWPLSTDEMPKQFMPVFDGNKSMLMLTYEKVKKLNDDIFVSTQNENRDIVLSQTDNFVKVIGEPFLHNTFAAFLNIGVYLKYEALMSDDEFVAILPTDHRVSDNFYNIIYDAEKLLKNNDSDFCLIGINPTYPSSQYGYILHDKSYVTKFLEKPDEENALKLISQGAVWNSGILVFRLKAMISISRKYLNYNRYEEFLNNYGLLPKNSFDYEVLEKMENLMIVLSNEAWEDLGSWNALYEKISKPDEYNTNIINKENKKIVNHGVKNVIIVNTPDGIALYPKSEK